MEPGSESETEKRLREKGFLDSEINAILNPMLRPVEPDVAQLLDSLPPAERFCVLLRVESGQSRNDIVRYLLDRQLSFDMRQNEAYQRNDIKRAIPSFGNLVLAVFLGNVLFGLFASIVYMLAGHLGR